MCSLLLLKIKKIFLALGNDRPQILVQVEDCVLQAIIAISEGNSSETIIDTLYSKITSLEKDLGRDDEALNWFNLTFLATPSTALQPEIPSTPLTGVLIHFTILIHCLTRMKQDLTFLRIGLKVSHMH